MVSIVFGWLSKYNSQANAKLSSLLTQATKEKKYIRMRRRRRKSRKLRKSRS